MTDGERRMRPMTGDERRMRPTTDGDRGVSPVVSYVLALGIVTLLLSGLIVTFAPLVENQQQGAVHSTLEVLGHDVAGDVESVDRLAVEAGDGGTVVFQTWLPDRVEGSPYEIEVDGDPSGYEITLRSVAHETSAVVEVRTRTDIDVSAVDTLDGGPIEIAYDGDTLVIQNV